MLFTKNVNNQNVYKKYFIKEKIITDVYVENLKFNIAKMKEEKHH